MSIASDTPHPHTVTLCASPRLAQGIRQWRQAEYQRQGLAQWQSPQVYPLQAWLDQTIEQAILCGQIACDLAPVGVLDNTQEALLWQQAISQSLQRHEAAELFNTSGLASAAMEANRYVIEWNISLDMTDTSEETRQFLRWRQQFQQLCKQSGMLESVRYQAWQLEQLTQSTLPLPGHIELAGFDRINPHLQRLLQLLADRGVQVSHMQPQVDSVSTVRMSYSDGLAECRAAVAWAQQHLATHPEARLAIVVPALDTWRNTLANLLDDCLHPETLDPAQAELPRCYEFSLGLPLHRWPMVDTALRLLRLAFHPGTLAQTELSALLGDIYWSQALQESHVRAQLDAEMRTQLPLSVHGHTFARFVSRKQEAPHAIPCPRLQADLQALFAQAKQAPRKQLPSAWAATFEGCLQATHWPGERSLSSTEFQCRESFSRVLSQLAGLDVWLGPIAAMSALQQLTQLCQAQIFQPQTVVQPNIIVMGMLEAAAHPLDGVWVMGMNDHAWPPLSRTNALLPAELQRKAGTPNASSEVQMAFASQIHQRLRRSAKQVIFSYATMDGDRLLRMSPLLNGIEEHPPLPTVHTLAETLARETTQDWQWLDDQRAPPVEEGEHVSGGTGLLRAQAICPAWAFYQYRLKARKLDAPKNGLDAMERGDLIHRVLAAFWSQTPAVTWATVSPEDLKTQLEQIASTVMAEFNSAFAQPFSAIFCQLEAERLSKLALTWLWEVERERPQAYTATLIEKEFKLLIEGIQVKLVIDRVDTLDDGRLVVIDYKTGSAPDFKNWASAQITEPQLPVYAAFLLQDADIAAVCFGKVRLTDGGFAGVAAGEDVLPGVKAYNAEKNNVFPPEQFPDWPSLLSHWRHTIIRTAQSLKTGEAGVVFTSEKDLAYCDVLPLLRLPERQLQFEQLQSKPQKS